MPLDVFPYQDEAARWIATRERAGEFDEMGIGKTATMIRAHDYRRARRGICVCPAFLRMNWLREYQKFATIERRILVARSVHDLISWQRERFDVLLMSFEQAANWHKRMVDSMNVCEFLDVDEGHYAKNPFTARTKALVGVDGDGYDALAMLADQIGWITGTLHANDPSDSYVFLKLMKALGTQTYGKFVEEFFTSTSTAYSTRNTVRPEKLAKLQGMIEAHGIRRTHEDVGLQLPKIFLTTSVVDGDTSEILEMMRSHPYLDEAIIEAVNAGGLSKIDAAFVATLRRLIGEAKAIPYAEMLANELAQSGRKRVVFGIHRGALSTIRDYLSGKGIRAVLVNGDTPETRRREAVDDFQNNDQCQVFLGNMRAAGVGITLTASADIDLFESDWTPAANAQAIKRVHRIGQLADAVHARFISLAKSFDEAVNDIVVGKTKAIAAIEGTEMIRAAGTA